MVGFRLDTFRTHALWIGAALILVAALQPTRVTAQAASPENSLPSREISLAELKAESKSHELIVERPRRLNVSQAFRDQLTRGDRYRRVYALQMPYGHAVQLDLSSKELDTLLRVYDETGKFIAENDDWAGSTNSRLYLAAANKGRNRFYVVARATRDRDGLVELELRERETPKDAQQRPIAFGQNITGKLEPTSALSLEKQAVYDAYTFDGTAGEVIKLVATPTEAPIQLELRLNQEKPVKSFSNVPGRPTTISGTLSGTGRYELIVSSSPSTSTEYKLDLTKVETQATQILTLGEFSGEFGPNSPVVPGTDRPYALYRFNGQPGQSVSFSVTGKSDRPTRNPTGGFTVELGSNTPIGFASALHRMRSPSASSTVTFEKEWMVLIRVTGPPGTNSAYSLQIAERMTDVAPAALTEE